MKSAYLTFSLFHEDLEYRVSGLYTPPDPGQTSGPPEKCYPPEPDEFEIDSAEPQDSNGEPTPEDIFELLQEAAREKAAEIYSSQKDF